jgi:BirA family biotin operon repressor/biotin-[acetyl-CoA-carboxylase] ligase
MAAEESGTMNIRTVSLNTLFTGRHLTILETVDSTNSYLNSLLSIERLPEGAVIVAHEQTAGRGLASEKWESEAGKNLLMSGVFYPSFLSTQHLFLLSKSFSLAVYDALKEILSDYAADAPVKIKWPNDIYAGDRKLCGMLIENSIRNPNINHTLLGIGLNINQEKFPSTLPNPVSLKMILGKDLSASDCFSTLCSSLESRYLQLKAGHTDQINEDYLGALFRFGEFHTFQNSKEKFRAKITAIGDDGKIFLKNENGLIGKYDFKEVKFVF